MARADGAATVTAVVRSSGDGFVCLRHNLPSDVLAELFGCGSTTMGSYQEELEALIDMTLSPLFEEIREQVRRGPS